MSKTRVVQVTQPNGPFELVEREIPEPAAEWVRIKVEACGICHSDSGVTTFNSLRNSGARPNDLVAILGLGGLGHLGVQFAAKMGFKTIAIARGSDKEPLARQLGAQHYIDSRAQDVAGELVKLGGAK